jgi:hypothetical protein
MGKEEYSAETCFQCKNKFVLLRGHVNNYNASGLCPACYALTMEEMHQSPIEARLDMIIQLLTEIKEEIK